MRTKILDSLFLMIIDIGIILFIFSLSYYLRLGTFSHGAFAYAPFFHMSLLITPIWWGLLLFSGRYSLKEQSFWQHAKHVLFASLSASLLFPLLFYFKNELFFSRGIMVLVFVLGTVFLCGVSYLMIIFSRWKASRNIGISRMLVIGAGKSAQKIIHHLLDNNSLHKPVAIITPYGSKQKEIEGVPIFGKLDALERVFLEQKIDEVFLCEAVEHSENLASFCRNKGVVLRTSLETLGVNHHSIDAEIIGDTTFLTLQQSPLFGWGQFFKRLFDLVLSSILIIFWSPYFLLHRKDLTTIPFVNGTETTFQGLVFKNKDGVYSQNISLLWNIFKKDMSFVGPKVCSQKEYETLFATRKEHSASRFILRPGLIASYSLSRTSVDTIIRKDIQYIRKWSFWNDLSILYSQR